MKKLLFVLMMFIAVSINATVVDVHLVNGKHIEGVLVEQNDTILIVRPSNMPEFEDMLIKPVQVKYFYASGIGRFVVEDGKFVPTPQAKAAKAVMEQKAHKREQQNRVLAANPNEVIGKAFKTTGDVCIGIGVPSLVAGAILVGIGYSDVKLSKTDAAKNIEAHANCKAAGFVLLPFGAALTIVGIPLNIHGKRIAELNFNYTGNGAGMSVDF